MGGKPWLNRYDPDVPHSLEPYPDLTLIDVVAENAHRRPNHPALLFKGSQLTYDELDKLSNGFASSLVALGVEKEDRVAILLPNCPQFLVVQLGAWKAGTIVAPLNPLYTERELEHALRDCGAKIAVVLTSFYEKVRSLRSRVGLQIIIATNIKEFLPKITRLLFTLFREKKQGHRVNIDSVISGCENCWKNELNYRLKNCPSSQMIPRYCFSPGALQGLPRLPLAVITLFS